MSHRHCIALGPNELGCTPYANPTISTGDSRPIHRLPRRLTPAESETIKRQVTEMLKNGVAGSSTSLWASPVVSAKKKDGAVRFRVDYRKLNSTTKLDFYALPHLDDTLDRLQGAEYFTTLDLMSGYCQVRHYKKDPEKSAFITPNRLYRFNRVHFGLCNAPATSQRLMAI